MDNTDSVMTKLKWSRLVPLIGRRVVLNYFGTHASEGILLFDNDVFLLQTASGFKIRISERHLQFVTLKEDQT